MPEESSSPRYWWSYCQKQST